MTRAKDISKIVTDADLSGTLDVTGTVTAGGLTVDGNIGVNRTATGQSGFSIIDVGGAAVSGLLDLRQNDVRQTRIYNSSSDTIIRNDGGDIYLQPDEITAIRIQDGGDISFYEDTGTTAKLFWDASQERLGIGTSSPGADLHISSIAPLIRLTDTNDSNVDHFINGSGSAIVLSADENNELADSTLRFAVDGTERVRIDDSGNVGIGTNSPSSNLEVKGANNSDAILTVTGGTTAGLGSNVKIKLIPDGTAGLGVINVEGSDGSDVLALQTNGSERMRIDSSGNVGIGTSSPATKLDIIFDADSGIKFDTISGAAGTLITSYHGTNNSNVRNLEINCQNFIVETGDPTGTATTERMRIDSSGDVEITGGYASSQTFQSTGSLRISSNSTTATANVALELMNDAGSARTLATFTNLNGVVGSISTNASATAYNTSSDYRLKENVVADWDATTRLKQLNPVRFNFIADPDTTVDGFLAHEVQDIVPEAISGTKDEVDDDGNPVYQGIDQSKLVPLLVKTIQELEARIAALESN